MTKLSHKLLHSVTSLFSISRGLGFIFASPFVRTSFSPRLTPAFTTVATILYSPFSSHAMMTNWEIDPQYPGTAVQRMHNIHKRVESLSEENDLSGEWESVRQKLLWAGGLRNLKTVRPGSGYTGHAFNDYNHCDLTAMLGDVADNQNDGRVKGIAIGNKLGEGIRTASLPELGPGGSWSTCMIGCNKDPPRDVAHVQFRSRIAFKLVWCPNKNNEEKQQDNNFTRFVLVDDDGTLLKVGRPTGRLPSLQQRVSNYAVVKGSKYADACKVCD